MTTEQKLIFHIFSLARLRSLSEFNQRENNCWSYSSKNRGRTGGRPKALTAKQRSIAQSLYDDPKTSIVEMCRTLKISKVTLYRAIKTGEGH
jgi:hypothetical protein